MIKAVIYEIAGRICGFKVQNHGETEVCAGVSMLCHNAVNSLESLTTASLEYRYDPKGGYLECFLPGDHDDQADLLLRSMALGLAMTEETYGSELSITVKPVEKDFSPFKTKHSSKDIIEYKR